jgi:hypothetical protein
MSLENFSSFFAKHDFCSHALEQLDVPCQPRRRHADNVGFSKTSKIQFPVTSIQRGFGTMVGIQCMSEIIGELRTPLLNPMLVKNTTLQLRHLSQRNGRELSNRTIRSEFLWRSSEPTLYNPKLLPFHFLKPLVIYPLPKQFLKMPIMGPHKMGLDICPRLWIVQPRQYIFKFSQCLVNIPIVFPRIMFFCPRGFGSFPYMMESEILKQIGFGS